MTRLQIVEYLWKNMNSVEFNIKLLEQFDMKDHKTAQAKFKNAFKNLARRKQYNRRIMGPKISKIKKDLDKFLKTQECRDYFANCTLVSSITNEEVGRETYKSAIRTDFYTKKAKRIKRQRLHYNYEIEEEEDDSVEEEEEEGEDNMEEQEKEDPTHSQRQHLRPESDVDLILEDEHTMAILNTIGEDDSFNSLAEQEANCGILNYLDGDGQLVWNPVHSDSSVLNMLIRFRDINIIGAQHHKVLNDIRVLSLSYIFVFGHSTHNNARLCEYINIKDCSSICQQPRIPVIESSQAVISDLLGLQASYCNYMHNLDHFTFTTSSTTGLAQKIITNTYNCLHVWNDSSMTEIQFSNQAVFPLVLPLFAGCHVFEISKFDKTMTAMKDYKPDLLITLKLKFGNKIDFFVCEIKKQGCSGNRYESDFAKIQREMKEIINQQIDLGVNNPLTYGLLVEGYDCSLYQMSLQFEGEYRSRLIAQFRILRDALDTMLLLPAINILTYLDEELTRLRTMILGLHRSQRGQSQKTSFKRPSFKKPIKID